MEQSLDNYNDGGTRGRAAGGNWCPEYNIKKLLSEKMQAERSVFRYIFADVFLVVLISPVVVVVVTASAMDNPTFAALFAWAIASSSSVAAIIVVVHLSHLFSGVHAESCKQ